MKISVYHPKDAGAIPLGGNPKSRRWIYADNVTSDYYLIEKRLHRECRWISSREFQAEIKALRDDFVGWVDDNLRHSSPIRYLITPLEKSTYNNDLFLHFSWAVLLGRFDNPPFDELIIITTSWGFEQTIRLMADKKGWGYDCKSVLRLQRSQMLREMRSFLGSLYYLGEMLFRHLAARLFLGESYVQRLRSIDTLIDIYAHRSRGDRDGFSQENQYPGLYEYLSSNGRTVGYYPLFFSVPFDEFPAIYRKLVLSDKLFALPELFATIRDIFSAWRTANVAAWFGSQQYFPFQQIELTPLAQLARRRSCLNGFLPLLMTKIPRRMYDANVRPKTVIEWFENQPIDKANVIGFHALEERPRMIASRQWPPLSNLLSLFSTGTEVHDNVAPRENWICGRGLLKSWARYDKETHYRIVPALRYQHVYHPTAAVRRPPLPTLVVLLSFPLEEALLIIERITGSYKSIEDLVSAVHVRAHPSANFDFLHSYTRNLWHDTKISLIDDALSDLLRTASLVVSIHSSAIIEAICYGVPAIILGKDAGLDENPVEDIDSRMWQIVYGSDEFETALRQWVIKPPLTQDERMAIGRAVRDDYFEPMTEDSMKSFLAPPRNEPRSSNSA